MHGASVRNCNFYTVFVLRNFTVTTARPPTAAAEAREAKMYANVLQKEPEGNSTKVVIVVCSVHVAKNGTCPSSDAFNRKVAEQTVDVQEINRREERRRDAAANTPSSQ